MPPMIRCVSPVDGQVYCERTATMLSDARDMFADSGHAQARWASTPLAERCKIMHRAVDHFVSISKEIARELALQMGRPVSQGAGELAGLEERARYMINIASEALDDEVLPKRETALRSVRREALGTVLVIAPWNFPYLTASNAIFPALCAGNAVMLKHSAQTLLCGERFAEAFVAAGLPSGIFQTLLTTNTDTTTLIEEGWHDHVVFTGSVGVGRHLQRANAAHFKGIDLELGGKDPAYVRADANIFFAANALAEGAFFNSGQSCCAIERIYVDRTIYAPFMEAFSTTVRAYRLGDPTDAATTLGPVVSTSAAKTLRDQVEEAVRQGARAIVDREDFPADDYGTAYLAPQILVDVTHDMRIMNEESFGPVVGIMAVDGDDEAVRLMNDSRYGLTSSIWTADLDRAETLSTRLQTGTCFANRCDYLDPGLPWTGLKDTGRGCSLSIHAYDNLTRMKSYHFRTQPTYAFNQDSGT